MKFEKIDEECIDEIINVVGSFFEKNSFEDFNDNTYKELEDYFYQYLSDQKYVIFCGVTKFVIVPKYINFVVKIPFFDANGIDHCKLEANNSFQIEEAELDEYIAKSCFYKEYNRIPFYVQEKAECDYCSIDDEMAEIYYSSYEEEFDEYGDFLDYFYNLSDKEKIFPYMSYYWGSAVYKMMNLIDSLQINDLHSGNVGFINGNLVLIDYSGYHTDSQNFPTYRFRKD